MRKFSSTFYKALDAILDIRPEDKPPQSAFERYRDNPLPLGFPVAVYTRPYQDLHDFICFAIVTGRAWSEKDSLWNYEVMHRGKTIPTWSHCLRPATPYERRGNFILIEGGRACQR